MRLFRRTFLTASSSAAALVLSRASLGEARGLLSEPVLEDVVGRALDQARKDGASYADVRVVRRHAESVRTREDKVRDIGASEDYGLGIRVIAQGAWGFAATPHITQQSAASAASSAVAVAKANAKLVKRPVVLAPNPVHVDVWQTPLIKDPFKIPLEEKAELLLALNAEALKVKGVKFADASYYGMSEWKLLVSSEGACIEQQITRVAPQFEVTAIDEQ
jgi:TldD protein